MPSCKCRWRRTTHVYIRGHVLEDLDEEKVKDKINRYSLVKVNHVYKEREAQNFAHLHFETHAEASEFYYAYRRSVFSSFFHIETRAALSMGLPITYKRGAKKSFDKKFSVKCEPQPVHL